VWEERASKTAAELELHYLPSKLLRWSLELLSPTSGFTITIQPFGLPAILTKLPIRPIPARGTIVIVVIATARVETSLRSESWKQTTYTSQRALYGEVDDGHDDPLFCTTATILHNGDDFTDLRRDDTRGERLLVDFWRKGRYRGRSAAAFF
jgi:hypothetical protein